MRMLLSLLSAVSLTPVAITSVIACDVLENWKKVGIISDDKQKITYQFKQNTFYRVGYSVGSDLRTAFGSVKYITFKYISTNSENILLDSLIDKFETNITSWIDLVINRNGYISLEKHNWNVGFMYVLEEGITENSVE